MGMKIEECLCTKVNYDGKEMEYSYRLTKKTFKNEEVYGIEIERKDNNLGKTINIERDCIEIVSKEKEKASKLLNVLFNNNVSPIHLVDIISPYVEENYEEEFLN